MKGLLGHIVESVRKDMSQYGERRGPGSETQLWGLCNAVKLLLSEALSSCQLPLLHGTLPKTRTPEWNEVTKWVGCLGMWVWSQTTQFESWLWPFLSWVTGDKLLNLSEP